MTAYVPAPVGADRPVRLTRDEARARTEEVKADAHALWRKMLALYEDGAHWALGYRTWPAYLSAEFDIAEAHAYRLVRAARVDRALDECPSPTGQTARPASERVARELAPVLSEGPEAVREAWDRTLAQHGPEPTAAQAAQVVRSVPGDAENGNEGPHTTRCPTCGSALADRHAVISADPGTVCDLEPGVRGWAGEPQPAWMADPGPEPGWRPLVDDVAHAESIAAENWD